MTGSVYHVSSAWPDFYPDAPGEIRIVDVSVSAFAEPELAGDALAAPTVETLLPASLTLWPRGAAWGTPDGQAASRSSVLAGLTRAMLAPFADLYARAWSLLRESFSALAVDALDDWSADHGVPGPCLTADLTPERRRQMVRDAVMGRSAQTPADMVRLAHRLGYTIAIYEPVQFRCGQTALGEAVIGVEGFERQWAVMVFDLPATHFRAGDGQAGVTRLSDFDFSGLSCALEQVRPAWSQIVYNLGPHETLFVLTDEAGTRLTDQAGRPLFVRIIADHYL